MLRIGPVSSCYDLTLSCMHEINVTVSNGGRAMVESWMHWIPGWYCHCLHCEGQARA